MLEELKKLPRKMPNPRYAVRITVQAIFDQSMGPNGGKQIA
jgi:hypothetical protein